MSLSQQISNIHSLPALSSGHPVPLLGKQSMNEYLVPLSENFCDCTSKIWKRGKSHWSLLLRLFSSIFKISRIWIGGEKGGDIPSRGSSPGKSMEAGMNKIYLENRGQQAEWSPEKWSQLLPQVLPLLSQRWLQPDHPCLPVLPRIPAQWKSDTAWPLTLSCLDFCYYLLSFDPNHLFQSW